MGSVSSLVAGNSLNSKHVKASDYPLKEGTSSQRKSGGCNLDGLLKCGFAQSSSSATHLPRGLSHSRSGRSEDFFYIKVNHKQRSAYHRERSFEKAVSRNKESDGRQQTKLLFMPGKILEKPPTEKSLIHTTAFKSVNTTASTTDFGNIIGPTKKASTPNVGHKQDPLGTLSDSGRNSMSSLPTHSTSGSLRASTGLVSQNDGSTALINSLSKGQQPSFPLWVNGNNTNLDCTYRACLNSSVSASKANEGAGSPLSADELRIPSEMAGGIRSPITTDEFQIEHLEQRLLERETELQELQVSLEEKEAETCVLFEERQRFCAEEMDGLKERCKAQLREVSHVNAKTHQALQQQVCYLQIENGKLQEDVSKLTREKDLAELRLRSYEKESTQLVPTLEEIQWEVCQKTGEISLLKQQLRDCQADVSHKLNEIVSLRASLKENSARVERLEQQNKDYEEKLYSCTREAEVCHNELQRKKIEADFLRVNVGKLEQDIQQVKQDLLTAGEQKLQKGLEIERPDQELDIPDQVQETESQKHIFTVSLQREVDRLKEELREEKNAQERLVSSFEQERQTWNKEKDRVIRYQKQLQINYLQMHKRNQDLERILKELTAELESRTQPSLDLRYSAGLQTYEDVIATEI
ncbi:PREDICTED: leucine zipper putative tumor suppressor 1-like [Cyprinodon variegatus]|uniref:Leucine zipper, putative tumor suppressor 1 n=1 Tax=Cyprinodon variegatus TaxID=28743 RepID=A0A3Q2DVD7_CYPVA|nr:PREDICTED: leucine zipper putative tumor suppressor 1-like [Cyprinodon variegatus]XP_015228821.1 PREDICTED: leucine zipper putative tumor suppressor 1-like [Cyprinodon variegatus]